MDKKTLAIVRIVSWSAVAVALIVVLILGMSKGGWESAFGGFSIGYNSTNFYADAEKYTSGGAEIDGDEISDLEVNWISGNIVIETYDGDTVQFSEESKTELNESQQLHYYNKDGRLIIQYKEAEKKIFSWWKSHKGKDLTIKIPKNIAQNLNGIVVDGISSMLSVSGLTADSIKVDTLSGKVNVVNCHVGKFMLNSMSGALNAEGLYVTEEIEVDTLSGAVDITGSIQELEFDSMSGNLTLDSDICPDKITTDSLSGKVTLYIPENDGFTYRKDSLSGSFVCDFQVEQKEDRGTYKDGGATFSFDTMSGNISIRKK